MVQEDEADSPPMLRMQNKLERTDGQQMAESNACLGLPRFRVWHGPGRWELLCRGPNLPRMSTKQRASATLFVIETPSHDKLLQALF